MQTWEAWPFAVATHPDAGYHNVLLPPLLTEARLARDLLVVLREVFEREDKETRPGLAYAIDVDSPHVTFAVVFRIGYARSETGALLTDRASRRVPLVQGVVFREPVPVPVAANALQLTRIVTTGAFRIFWGTDSAALWPKAAESVTVTDVVPDPVPPGYVTEVHKLRPVRLEESEPARLAADRTQAEAAGIWRGWLATTADIGSAGAVDTWLCSSVHLDAAFARYVVERLVDNDPPLAEPPSGIDFVTLGRHARTSVTRSARRSRRTVLIALLTIVVGAVVAAAAASGGSPLSAALALALVAVAGGATAFLQHTLTRLVSLRHARGVLNPARAPWLGAGPLSTLMRARLADAAAANVIACADDAPGDLFGVRLGGWQLEVDVPSTLTATDLYRDLVLALTRDGQARLRSLLLVPPGQRRRPVAGADELYRGIESAQTRLCAQVSAFDGELVASVLFKATVDNGRLSVDCQAHLYLPVRAELCAAAAIPDSPWAVLWMALRGASRTKRAEPLAPASVRTGASGSLRSAVGGAGRASQFSYDDLQRQIAQLQQTALRTIRSSALVADAGAPPADDTGPDIVEVSIADLIAGLPDSPLPWHPASKATTSSAGMNATEPAAQTS